MIASVEALGYDEFPPEPFSHLWEGLAQLLGAYRRAEATAGDPWQFAVPIQRLRSEGLSDSELRVLILTAIIDHRVEKTEPRDTLRSFERTAKVGLCDRSCFMLTEVGLVLARCTADYARRRADALSVEER